MTSTAHPFRPKSTMQEVALQNGEPPTDHPQTVCPAITRLVNALEPYLDPNQKRALRELAPVLAGTRDPSLTAARHATLTARALRVWAPQALRAAQRNAAASAIESETSRPAAASLAQSFSQMLDSELPPEIRSEPNRIKRHAALALRHAAKAATLIEDPDWTISQLAADNAAMALADWASATSSYPIAELQRTLRILMDPAQTEPAPAPHPNRQQQAAADSPDAVALLRRLTANAGLAARTLHSGRHTIPLALLASAGLAEVQGDTVVPTGEAHRFLERIPRS